MAPQDDDLSEPKASDEGGTDPPSVLSRADLRRATMSGIRWITLARLAAELLLLVASVVLARLIPPPEFGRAAVALIVVAVATVSMAQGIGAAIVQMRSADRLDLQSATLVALGSGAVLAGITIAFGSWAAPGLLGDRIGRLIQLSSLAFVFASFGAVSQAVLQRGLNFRRIGMIEVASLLCGTITSVALAAAAGLDAEALVAGGLATSATISVLSLASVPLARPRWDRDRVHRITSFGVPSGFAALAYTVFRQVDYAIIAVRLSATEVGLYWRAYQLGVEYQSKITGIMLRITFPVFSRTATMEDMRAVRTRIVRLHATTLLPLLATFIAVAPVLIPWLFGPAWEPSVGPSQLLAVVGMGTAIVTGIGPLMLAAGKQRELLVYNVVTLIIYAAAIYIVAPYGLIAICLAVLGVQGLNFVATHYLLLHRMMGIAVSGLWREIAPGVVSSLALLAVTYPLSDGLGKSGLGSALTLLIASTVACVISVAVIRRLFPAAWADALLVARSVRSRGKAAVGGG